MAPFSSQPAVIVVEPADHGADIEGAIDGVELEGGAEDAGAIGDDGSRDDGAEEFGAFFEAEAFETAADGVEEDEAGCVELGAYVLVLWMSEIQTSEVCEGVSE